MNHHQIWRAIELLAHAHGMSCSGLAKISGLDPTSFNKSKRVSKYGQPRWPSLGSIAKILDATGETFVGFCQYLSAAANEQNNK